MNGVMIPETSAGSNHTGASETWMPQVSCPSGPTAKAASGAPATSPKAVRANISRRVNPFTSAMGADPLRSLTVISMDLLLQAPSSILVPILARNMNCRSPSSHYEGQRGLTVAPRRRLVPRHDEGKPSPVQASDVTQQGY